ncbi:MAG TPA: hypothetical protein VGQ69_04755 [Gemmatimonadales bacterium]|jgi:hypothetical protein|nr:hypothetical protein [Gemmatimonadales bacterium]HEV8598648.1 hypothetical protein [Gemmatimonadales bacterium]
MEPKAILPEEQAATSRKQFAAPMVADPMLGWRLLFAVGLLFVVVGLLNLVLLWMPLQLGNAEYEFASVAASLDSLPLPTMGLVFVLAASRAAGKPASVRVATVLALVLAVVVLGMAALYWLDVPLALKAVRTGPVRLGILKSITKVTAQAILYPVALVVLVRMANRGKQG